MKIEILPLNHGKVYFHEIPIGECFVFDNQIHLKVSDEQAFYFSKNWLWTPVFGGLEYIPVKSKLVIHKKDDETSYY
jgi:CRISPR/Cas system CSM-associated protein Csm5 (group 7 of RAMP superfamily)